jgi:hypothetical protein
MKMKDDTHTDYVFIPRKSYSGLRCNHGMPLNGCLACQANQWYQAQHESMIDKMLAEKPSSIQSMHNHLDTREMD